MRDPSKFYDENRHRRLMPKQDLSEPEITDLIAFLDWVSKVDNQGWPPRPLLVAGASFPGTDLNAEQAARTDKGGSLPPGARPVNADLNPMALGQSLFRSVTPACSACHSVAEGVNMAGPSLGGIATTALQRIAAPEYKGKAKDAESYIRESIEQPSAYALPGAMYSADGRSFMPPDYATTLTPEQIDQLVAYLASLK
jgi:nitric oxide reductase subunit C